jgi:hypothetical protein
LKEEKGGKKDAKSRVKLRTKAGEERQLRHIVHCESTAAQHIKKTGKQQQCSKQKWSQG